MVDDVKRQHDIKLWLTDREFLDLSKAAEREDRKVGEMGRVIVRRYMYGNIGPGCPEIHGRIVAMQGAANDLHKRQRPNPLYKDAAHLSGTVSYGVSS